MGVEQVIGACVTSQFGSVFNSLSALESVARVLGGSFLTRGGEDHRNPVDELKRFRGNLGSQNNQRNRIVHDARFRRKRGTIARFEIIAKSNPQFGLVDETIEELPQFCLDVDRIRREFLSIWKKVSAELEARPGLSQQRFPPIVLNDLDQPYRSNIKRVRHQLP